MTTRTRLMLGVGVAVLVATAAAADQEKTQTKKESQVAAEIVVSYYVGDLIIPADRAPGSPKPGGLDMTSLIDLITSKTAQGTWLDPNDKADRAREGKVGAITPEFLTISLIVHQTEQGHDEVQDLFKKLRRLQEAQVKNAGIKKFRDVGEVSPVTYYVGDLVLPGGRDSGDRAQEQLDMTPLIELITSKTAQGTWLDPNDKADRAEAGKVGAITPLIPSMSLIVRQTEQGHAEVQDLLRKLRRLQ